MKPEYRATILKSHNDYRATLAQGIAETPNGYARRAKNLYKLTYDCNLESKAQEWASRCVYEHSPNHWRNDAGENLWTSFATYPLPINGESMTGATKYWWGELKKYGIIDSSYKYSGAMYPIGHWTQMAWSNTTRVGCGVADCPWMNSGWQYNIYVVCHYSEAGNYRGHQIYEFGDGCRRDSDCTLFSGSKCETQTGLCLKPGQITEGRPQPRPQPTEAPKPNTKLTQKPNPNPRPEETCVSRVMTPQLRGYVLKTHNGLRSDLANGRVANKRSGKNIYKLKYDCDLEARAQEWADRCDIDSAPKGNMYYDASGTKPKTAAEALKTALKNWWQGIEKNDLGDNTFTSNTPAGLLAASQGISIEIEKLQVHFCTPVKVTDTAAFPKKFVLTAVTTIVVTSGCSTERIAEKMDSQIRYC
ncbi:Ancylostoma secreted protein [Toxocara canis]|uniref:Ancylostoma secreted protein n=1 Tax=Toxocara canis TaxID=6265 RepID=A0A0B2UP29_TOXCA|nr:Ancylostoma secreted protein [Toxocara canis]